MYINKLHTFYAYLFCKLRYTITIKCNWCILLEGKFIVTMYVIKFLSNSNHIYHEEQHSVQHFLFYLPQVEPIFYLSTTCMYIMLQVDRYFFIYTPLPNQILQQIGHSREDFDVNTKVVYNII